MDIWNTYALARINIRALVHNYTLIRAVAANPAPVVKSDAYGHGLKEVARAFFAAGARCMAAGTVEESVALKEVTPGAEVISLLGPLDQADYTAVCTHGLIPFVGHVEQLVRLEEEGKRIGVPVRVALKFDTGMSRLGFAAEAAYEVADVLDGLDHVRAVLACSHLATADDPKQAEFVSEQGQRFAGILRALHSRGLDVRGSLANSGAIFAHSGLHHDLQRPGIALYGGNPFFGTAWADKSAGLRPAMSVSSRLLQIRTIHAGESVSYGRTFMADRPMRVGIVAIGYADNYSRGLSGKGQMLLRGQRVPVLGRVCMQLTAVDMGCVPEAEIGDEVYVLGGEGSQAISADELASWWGTISYEVFCLLGQNKREYVK